MLDAVTHDPEDRAAGHPSFDIIRSPCVHDFESYPQWPRSRLQLLHIPPVQWRGRIREDCDAREPGHDLFERLNLH